MKYALKELDNEKLNGTRVTLEEAVSGHGYGELIHGC